ncbi:hypothetical protein H4R19_004515 [Coemansia spiralis]|nr:hypothetical protein H4R19_004515 [Coemansia spiralis]
MARHLQIAADAAACGDVDFGAIVLPVAEAETGAGDAGSAHARRQEVLERLTRYRDYYASEMVRQQERIDDIAKAQGTLAQHLSIDSQQCAIGRLKTLHEDALHCLAEAQLARDRLEMEAAAWSSSAPDPVPTEMDPAPAAASPALSDAVEGQSSPPSAGVLAQSETQTAISNELQATL